MAQRSSSKDKPERSAISRILFVPSERLSIHSNAICSLSLAAGRSPLRPQLRLPHGTEVEKFDVALQQIDHLEQRAERIGKVRGRHEVQIVGRRVILRVFAMRSPPEASDGKIEPWRTELSFVIAVGREVADFERSSPSLQHVLDGPIDVGSEAPAALVVDASPVTDAGQDKSMLDPADLVLIARQPCYRTDGPRHEKEAVSVAMRIECQDASERCGDRDARQVVIAHRWMTDVSRYQEFILDPAGEHALTISERSVAKR